MHSQSIEATGSLSVEDVFQKDRGKIQRQMRPACPHDPVQPTEQTFQVCGGPPAFTKERVTAVAIIGQTNFAKTRKKKKNSRGKELLDILKTSSGKHHQYKIRLLITFNTILIQK